jgi:hypothetical protein
MLRNKEEEVKRAALHARVSTEEQAKEGTSIEFQMEAEGQQEVQGM